MEHTFHTPDPVRLLVEVGSGSVALDTGDLTEAVIEVSGDAPDQVHVALMGDELRIVAPRQSVGFLKREPAVHIRAVVPHDSDCTVRTGSAGVTTSGTWGAVHIKSGSGDVRVGAARGVVVGETGSGSLSVIEAGAELRAKSGSGEITVDRVTGDFGISTGSGNISVHRADGAGVLKTGSGDIRFGRLLADLTLSTGSGDARVESFELGSLNAKTASGDLVVGVAPRIPVWTDISTVSGEIRSTLSGAGEPEPGAPFLELRARTASGDIDLRQL